MSKKNGTVKRKHIATKSVRRLKKIIKKTPRTRSKKTIKKRTIKRGGSASKNFSNSEKRKQNINSMNRNEYSKMSDLKKFLLFLRDPNKFEKLESQEMKNQSTRQKNNIKTLWQPVLDEIKKNYSNRKSEVENNIETIKTNINTMNKQRILILTSPVLNNKNEKNGPLASLTKAINEQFDFIIKEYDNDNKLIIKLIDDLRAEMDKYLFNIENITPPQFLIVLLTKYVNLKKNGLQLTDDERKKVDKYEREYPLHYNEALRTVLEHQKDFNLVDHEYLHKNEKTFKELLLTMGDIDEFLFKIKLQSLLNIYTPNNYYENLKKEYFKFEKVWMTSNSINTQKNKKENKFKEILANIIYNAGLKYFKQIYIDDDINGAKPAVLDHYKSKDLMFIIISELENEIHKTPTSIRGIHNKIDELGFSRVITDYVVLKQILFGEIEQILHDDYRKNYIKQGILKKVINAPNIYKLIEDFTIHPRKYITQPELAQELAPTIRNGDWRKITEKQFEMIKQTLMNNLRMANTSEIFISHLNQTSPIKTETIPIKTKEIEAADTPASDPPPGDAPSAPPTYTTPANAPSTIATPSAPTAPVAAPEHLVPVRQEIEVPKNDTGTVKPKGESSKNTTNYEKVSKKHLGDSVIEYRQWLDKHDIKNASEPNNEVKYVKHLIKKYPGEGINVAAATEKSLRESEKSLREIQN